MGGVRVWASPPRWKALRGAVSFLKSGWGDRRQPLGERVLVNVGDAAQVTGGEPSRLGV